MFKKKEYSPAKISKTQASDLAALIARMQKNADQVEKNVLRGEELLALDAEREKQEQAVVHQKECADNLAEAEGLLKDLFLDVDRSKRLQHPQSTEIERDVSNLHDRWIKDCVLYRDLYDQMQEVTPSRRIDWALVLDEKQRQLKAEKYGPNLSDVEKQIAAQNILHKEIEAYNAQLDPSSTTSQEEYSLIKDKYARLLEGSQQRGQHLASLYEYMQSCNKELVYMSEHQDRVLRRDWSDRMIDPPTVRMEYEKFKNNGLLSHESETTKLQEDGDRLVQMRHPATTTIQAHREAVQAEWQSFLNLCIAQETHLDNIEDYRKFQLDAETLSESLNRLNSNLDPKSLANKSNPEILIALEGDEPAVQRNDQRLAALRDLSSSIAPLKLRRIRPTVPTTAVALCEWADDDDSVARGEKLTLKSNSDNKDWEVQTSRGTVKTLPGACFMIPPPDPEALEQVDSLDRELSELKKRRAALKASARAPSDEVVRPKRAVAVASAPEDPEARILTKELDKILGDLERSERDLRSRVVAPLDRRDPPRDLEERLKEHEKATLKLVTLEAEKAAVQRDMEPILAQKPLGPMASTLPGKLSTANGKFDDLNSLADLFKKKAGTSMFLERQIKKVEGIVSGFEDQLAAEQTLLDTPNALQTRSQQLQALRDEVVSRQGELQVLGRDLELTEQQCSSLQKGFNTYCPDIQRQDTQVKTLKNRYASVKDELQKRSSLIQEATNKNQEFQSAVQSLDFFLINVPDNKLKPTDGLAQIKSKQISQKKLVEDIKKKSAELDRTRGLSHELQNVLNDYDIKADKYRGTLRDDDDDDDDDEEEEPEPKRRQTITMVAAVQKKERSLLNLYSEVSAENEELLNQTELAKNLLSQNEERVNQVVVNQQHQLQSQQRNLVETDGLKRELSEEVARRAYAENDLDLYRKRFISLKSRRGVERVEEKEVVHYYRDPKVEAELDSLKDRIKAESVKRTGTRKEIDRISDDIVRLETQLSSITPQLVTKVLTEYERDPLLDKEMERIREEMRRIRRDVQTRESETVHVKTEITVLGQKRPTIKERVVKKEVLRLEKDPVMLRAVLTFQNEIAAEDLHSKSINNDIFRIRSEINTLERVIPTIQPKIVTKVLKQIEQDQGLLEESKRIRPSLEEEKDENVILLKDLTKLQLRYSEVEKLRPKVEIKEVINEIYRVDPDTELELVRLKKVLHDTSRNRMNLEKESSVVMVDLNTQRSQKPKVEYKETTQEVIKEEKSPEVARELQRLQNQVSRLQVNYTTTLELWARLRNERDVLKVEKSKVETKVVTRELIKYENDPLLEKEADRVRRDVREEIQQRRTVEESIFDLQNKYIVLERQKPEERILKQEVVRLEKDPKQILYHEKLNRTLDEEARARRNLELEVRPLRTLVEEKEKTLALMDDRQKNIQAEIELRQIRSRILELENSPAPIEEKIIIEEVLKVERDPVLDKLTDGLRSNMETESTSIARLEREIRNLRIRLEILHKEKSIERIVYKEIIRVENDPTVEAERDHVRELVGHERNLRRDQEDELQNFKNKITRLQTTRSTSSQEEVDFARIRDALQEEKENLLRELNTLETERQTSTITFQQQSKLMSERNQLSRQKSLKVDSEIQRLERDILSEKDKLHQKDTLITELQNNLKKEDHSDTHTRETNLSTKITIMDPETGKDMSPYDAYLEGLIDRNQYIHLQELECDWEDITSMGPDGETSILQDRKSGRQFSLQDALKDGRLTEADLKRYKDGKMPISEFALLVAGDSRPKPHLPPLTMPRSPIKTTPSSPLNSLPPTPTPAVEDLFPISGIWDTTTESRMSVRSALTCNLIDADTALKLLEAQAATGGIVDINIKDKLSVHKAAQRGLIDASHMPKLLNAQKAFTGVEDPVTKERLATGQAAEKGWVPQDSAKRYMEAQYLTGGLVDPHRAGRVNVREALATKLIDSSAAQELQDEALHTKELVDPITKEKMSYKQAMDRCKRDAVSGLLLLPVASSDDTGSPSYSGYRFNNSHSQV